MWPRRQTGLVVVLTALAAVASGQRSARPEDGAVTNAHYLSATAIDAGPMTISVAIPAVREETNSADKGEASGTAGGDGNAIQDLARKGGRKLSDEGLPMGRPVVVVAAPILTAATLPPPAPLPILDGEFTDEDFMEDMQEIEQSSDMQMVERSVNAVTAASQVDEDQDQDGDQSDIPPNHKKARRDFKSSDQNSLLPGDKKQEVMMANLPVRDRNMTGRDEVLNVMFVFPQANETRSKELEVVLVFPQTGKSSTTATPGDSGTRLPAAADDAGGSLGGSAPSERNEGLSSPAAAAAAPLPRDLDTGASQVRSVVLPPPMVPWLMAHGGVLSMRPQTAPAPAPASAPTPEFGPAPGQTHAAAQPMLIVVPPLPAQPPLNSLTRGGQGEESQALNVDAVATPDSQPATPAPPLRRGAVRHRFARPTTTTPTPAVETTAANNPYRRRRPIAMQRPGYDDPTITTVASPAASPADPTATAAVELRRTQARRRPMRFRPAPPAVDDTSSTMSSPHVRGRPQYYDQRGIPATAPAPAPPPATPAGSSPQTVAPRIRSRTSPRGRPQPSATPSATDSSSSPDPIAAPVVLPLPRRNRIPNVRLNRTRARPDPAAPIAAPGQAAPAPLLNGADVMPVEKTLQQQILQQPARQRHQHHDFQQQQQQLQQDQSTATTLERQERLSSLQSMLVTELVSIQRDLSRRQASMHGHGQLSRHLLADSDGAASSDNAVVVAAPPGPAPKRYRRPPSFRKAPAALAEDKEQAAKENKVSYNTLYKKRANAVGTVKLPSTTSTTTTTTPSPTEVTTTTDITDQQTTTTAGGLAVQDAEVTTDHADDWEAAASTDATDMMAAVTVSGTPGSTPGPAADTLAPSTTASPAAVDVANSSQEAESPVEAKSGATAAAELRPEHMMAAASDIVELSPAAGFLPSFLPSPKDPVLRVSRLALLSGVLPEDSPSLAGDLLSLERRDRSAVHLEGGFLPMAPASVAATLAGAPQIVGPIPSGYREVLRGTPVQLDLPRADRPADFHGQPPPSPSLRQLMQQG